MALRPPNPLLATETVTHVTRTLTSDLSGGGQFAGSTGPSYVAIVTLQKVNKEGLRERAGTNLSEMLWDVVIFNDVDPLILPQYSVLLVQGQDRILIATERSSYREAGAWYVLCRSVE